MLKKRSIFRKAATAAYLTPALAVIALSVLPDVALANSDTTQILKESCSTVALIQTWIFRIAYILAAIGLVVVAVSAFLGRFKFAHLIALGGGLFIVAASDMLISFATGGQAGDNCNKGFNDDRDFGKSSSSGMESDQIDAPFDMPLAI
jgi:hypothetical protein